MRKLLGYLILAVTPVCVRAQESAYVKFVSSATLTGKKSNKTIIKGEILPKAGADKKNTLLLFGTDTLKLPKENKKIEPVNNITDHGGDQAQFVLSKGSDSIYVDLSTLNPGDTGRIVTENQQVIEINQQKPKSIAVNKAGQHFRLVISKSPSLFYTLADLRAYSPPPQAEDGRRPPDQQEEGESGFFHTLGWVQLTLIALIFLSLAAFTGWLFSHFKRGKERRGKGHQDEYNAGSNSIAVETFPAGPLSDVDEIKRRIHEAEQNILMKIGQLNSGSKSDNDNQRLRTEIEQLKTIQEKKDRLVTDLQTDKQRLADNIQQIERDKQQLKDEKQQLVHAKQELGRDMDQKTEELRLAKQELTVLQGKANRVEFLKDYSKKVNEFLKYCSSVRVKAHGAYESLNEINSPEGKVPGQLILKYQANRAENLQNWEQIATDIEDSGLTTNQMLIRSFKHITEDADKVLEFKRLLFSDMLEKELSALLILAEEFKNIAKFFESPSNKVYGIQDSFLLDSSQLTQKATELGIAPQYVSLFVNYINFSGHMKSQSQPLSPAYRSIKSLEKDAIAEIIRFGFETQFRKSDTIVIIA